MTGIGGESGHKGRYAIFKSYNTPKDQYILIQMSFYSGRQIHRNYPLAAFTVYIPSRIARSCLKN